MIAFQTIFPSTSVSKDHKDNLNLKKKNTNINLYLVRTDELLNKKISVPKNLIFNTMSNFQGMSFSVDHNIPVLCLSEVLLT
jgi:hypothetical protein